MVNEPIVRNLSTGELLVIDRESHDLYIVEASYTGDITSEPDPVATARQMAEAGQARHVSQETMQSLNHTLAGVALLG